MLKTLIIGNGFDLHCGLNSSYRDYFDTKFNADIIRFLDDLKKDFENHQNLRNTLYEEYNPFFSYIFYPDSDNPNEKTVDQSDFPAPMSNNSIPESLSELSFWDLLFYFQKDQIPNEWNDIEQRIKSFVGDTNCLDSCFRPKGKATIYNLVSSTFCEYFEAERYRDFNDEISFLKNELTILEKHFSKYLYENKESKKHYKIESIEFANKLLNLEDVKQLATINILNFNYTNPFENKCIEGHINRNGIAYQQVTLRVRNIHGTLKSDDTIFGIDPKGVITTDKSFTFTKTYRQLIGNISKSSEDLSFSSTKNEVIFYGHSLSSLDYSYFEAIFDKLNLYDSNTRLIFKFSTFSDKSTQEISTDYIDRITKLLEEYASTLENKDHKENLVSRLLLENRISIQEIY